MNTLSYRAQTQEAAKLFKNNWVLLGEHLTKVATDKLYEQWGHRTFEEYCRDEIKIKKSTAIKLTNAYFFITKVDPEIPKEINIDSVLALKQAREDDECSPELYADLRDIAVRRKNTAATIKRHLKNSLSENNTPQKQFFEESLKLVIRLKKRIGPVDIIPECYKGNLKEIQVFFEGQLETIERQEA